MLHIPFTEKIDRALGRLDRWLWTAENSGNTRLKRFVWHATRILFAVVRDLMAGSITLHAMGLVFTTLLSIIPFLALMFSVLKGFGVVQSQLEPFLLTWAEPLGEKGKEIAETMLKFVDNFNVGVLSSLGLGFLIFTVISLVQKVESSFNEIWRVASLRSIGQRFSNYLSVILIGPVLVFSALGATAAIFNSDTIVYLRDIEPFGSFYIFLSRLTPYFMIIGLFTFLYKFIPNTKVKIQYAFIGALVSGCLWQSTSYIFAKFFTLSTGFGTYAAVYSGFAIGFVSLWWLYLCWLILLIGSSIAFYSQHARQITRSRIYLPSASVDERTGLAMVYRVAKQFDSEDGGASMIEMSSSLSVGPETVKRIRDKLIKHNILMLAGEDNDKLVPAKTPDRISMLSIMHALRCPESPMPHSLTEIGAVSHLATVLEKAHVDVLEKQTLADWIRSEGEPVRVVQNTSE